MCVYIYIYIYIEREREREGETILGVLQTVTIGSQSTTNKMQRFSNLFISVRRCTCFGRVFRPPPGVQNCTYSVRYLSDSYCYVLLAAGSSNDLTNT